VSWPARSARERRILSGTFKRLEDQLAKKELEKMNREE
jgi:hypothetical protein